MNAFYEGLTHITDLQGYDHMLFLLALSAPFGWKNWKSLLLMATAFTLGHSITLVLVSLEIIKVDGDLIELLIPITIAMTSMYHFWVTKKEVSWFSYLTIVFFGLIHGMGFSSYFRMMFNEGLDMVRNLFLFNLGVEAGQVIILLLVLLAYFILDRFVMKESFRTKAVAAVSFIISVYLIFEKVKESAFFL